MKAITAVLLISAPVWAQQVAGTVESVRADAQQLTLKTDLGEAVAVGTTSRTVMLRIPPGVTDPAQGIKIALADMSVGDRGRAVGFRIIQAVHGHGGIGEPGGW